MISKITLFTIEKKGCDANIYIQLYNIIINTKAEQKERCNTKSY